MDIRFIPVLDLDYHHTSIPTPDFPFSNTAYQYYRQETFKASGFTDQFKSLTPDCFFYAIQEISDANLRKILKDTVFKSTSLNGGYALLDTEQQPILLPRCCSDLNDIHAWERLVSGHIQQFWIGHPQVLCEYRGDVVKFKPDASQDHTGFEIPLTSLRQAVKNLKTELKQIELRFQQLAHTEKLKVEKVLKLIPELS